MTDTILTGLVKEARLGAKPVITIEINEKADFQNWLDELQASDKPVVEIKRYHKKRTLTANAYCWLLVSKISEVLRTSKEEVYFEMLKRYGQSEMISVLSDIDIKQYLKYFEIAGESKLKGRLFTHYRVYKGSSEFNSKEMSVLIDGIISEAKELGIQTETPNEIAKMKALWRE